MFIIAGCSTVDLNKKARTDLSQCRFDISGIEFESIKKGEKGPESADFRVFLTIINPNDNDVILDHLDADLFLDQTKVATIHHSDFAQIKANASSIEQIVVNVPFQAFAVLFGKHPESLGADASIYVNILIGEFTLSTPVIVQVHKSIPVPWDTIGKEMLLKSGGLPDMLKKFIRK